jgi:hypothetical protein
MPCVCFIDVGVSEMCVDGGTICPMVLVISRNDAAESSITPCMWRGAVGERVGQAEAVYAAVWGVTKLVLDFVVLVPGAF